MVRVRGLAAAHPPRLSVGGLRPAPPLLSAFGLPDSWGGFAPPHPPLLSAFGLPDSWGASPPTPPLMSAFGLRVDQAHSGQGSGGTFSKETGSRLKMRKHSDRHQKRNFDADLSG